MLFLWTFCFSQFVYGQYLVPTRDKITNKYGYKEKDKIEWSLPPIYKNAHYFGGNLAIVNDGEFEFVIDLNGNKVSPNFKTIKPSINDELLPYICQDVNGNYNIFDTQFKPICKTSYPYMSYMGAFNVISFKSEDLYGLMDLEGNVLIPPIYKELSLKDYYYACGWKRCDKDGLDSKMFSEAFLEAQNKDGKWGAINPNNEVIVPFKYGSAYKLYKGIKGFYKKSIKPYILSSKKKELDMRIQKAKMRSSAKNKELAMIYPTDLPIVEKTVVKKTTGGYAFFKGGKQVGKTYQTIDLYDKCCIISKNGKYGIADPLGTETVNCEYDNICIWNAGMGNDVLLAEADGKYGLFNADGTKLSARDCDMIFLPSNNAGVAIKEGLYWLIDSKGNLVSQHGYENIDNYSTDSKIYAELLGYKTELSADGKEVSPIVKQIFDEAYNMSLSDNAQKKFDTYMLCISLDPNDKDGYRALSLNNIGAMFEDLGDVDKAMEYYEQSRNLGNETARKNIKRIKLDRTLNTLQQVGNALSQMAKTIDTSGSYNTLQQSSGNYGTSFSDNYDVSTGGNSNKHSYEFWKQQYDRWERNAKSCYDALTNTGYKTKKNGKDTGGSAAGSWGTVSFSGMKMNLRKAQKEMRDTRAKARKDGHNIPQSNYETINVSY